MYTITEEANKELDKVGYSLYRHQELMELLASILGNWETSGKKSEVILQATALAETLSLDMQANYSNFGELLSTASHCTNAKK